MDHARGWRSLLLDGVLAVGVTALALADGVLGAARLTPLDSALLLVGSLAITARTRAPRTVLLTSLVCGLAYTVRVDPGPIATVPVLIAVYTVVAAGYRVLAAAVVLPLMAFAVAGNLADAPGLPAGQAVQAAILPVGWFVAAVVLGEVTRHRRAYLHQAEQRAAEAERTREEVARRRAGEERLRIARELHDSLTHQISIITVQAGVAVHLARKRGDEVPDALLAVQQASREATRELRATLEVLRDTGGEPAARHGPDRLRELAERSSAAGVTATVTIDGSARDLPPEIHRAVYRVVQEALTNVGRHSHCGTASVTVEYGERELTVRVDDDGIARPGREPVPGVGLTGMRERVTTLGGRLRAGPRPEGGFTVEATLPLTRDRV